MIYNNSDRELSNYLLEEVKKLLEGKHILLHEYYVRVDDLEKDSRILKGARIDVYKLDRTEMTPHCHIKDSDGAEIEVSLIDWNIINVKYPKNTAPEWSNFTILKDKFFEWVTINSEKLFDTWNRNNPDNQVDNSYCDRNMSAELKQYIDSHEHPVTINAFKKSIYGVLSPLFAVKETKNELKDLDVISLLKKTGLFDEWHLKESNMEALKAAEEAIKDVKIWFSYV